MWAVSGGGRPFREQFAPLLLDEEPGRCEGRPTLNLATLFHKRFAAVSHTKGVNGGLCLCECGFVCVCVCVFVYLCVFVCVWYVFVCVYL